MRRHLEIERKFLVKSPPSGWKRQGHDCIEQGYLPMADPTLEIRLRRKGNQHFITIKCGLGGTRFEEEIPIARGHFTALWPLTWRARIAKTRYRLRHGKRTIELDDYLPPHAGLRTADIEFDSKRDSRRFRPPAWLGKEITGNPRYANRSLAGGRRRL